jgi:hypothetical protein
MGGWREGGWEVCLKGRDSPVAPSLRQSRTVLNVLLITFPFFALVLAGYLAARRGMLPLAAIPGLNGFVLFFALPCMLYRFGSTTPIAQLLDFSVAGVYLVCALIMVAFAIVWSLNERIRWNDASLGALVAAFPNTGFMGVPLLAALLGQQSAGPVIVLIVVDMVITSSLCVALSQLDGEPGESGGHAMMAAGRKALVDWRRRSRSFSLDRWRRPCGCWPMLPRQWRCSPSARCSPARRSRPTTPCRCRTICRCR